jgi:hypothetical protein
MALAVRPKQLAHQCVQVGTWARDEDYPVFPVGSKPKRLLVCPHGVTEPFLIPGHKYLFKIAQGWQAYQTWSEVIAYEIGSILGLNVPPAFIALDARTEEMGVLVEFFYGYPDDKTPPRFVHGADTLQRLYPGAGFNAKTGRPHVVRTNLAVCRTLRVGDATKWWARTLAFDAIIGNTDRHPENWGFLISRPAIGEAAPAEAQPDATAAQAQEARFEMAPVFDNATSLGYERTNASLAERWSQDRIGKYIAKGTHHCGWLPTQARGTQHIKLCLQLHGAYTGTSIEMKSMIRLTDSEIEQTLNWCAGFDVPSRLDPSRAEFVSDLLKARRDALAVALGA